MKFASPVAIGGIGGSGTRVVAEIVKGMGIFIGDNLNLANDNLDFPGLERFLPSNPNRVPPRISRDELVTFEEKMQRAYRQHAQRHQMWGWKLPPTFIFLDTFANYFPEFKYLHVIRNGMDMAVSKNKNQVRKWGYFFNVEPDVPSPERAALTYWIRANDFAISKANQLLGHRFKLVNFDDLCNEPISAMREISSFLGSAETTSQLQKLSAIIRPPESIGRYRRHRPELIFSREEVREVSRFGFEVEF